MNSVTLRISSSVCLWVRRAIPVLGVCLLLLLASVPAFSQGTARILGTVADSSGAPIAGAAVSVTDINIGATRTLITDESGAYNAPALRPGVKKIRVEYKGFKAIERENVRLEVGQDARIDFTLQPGAITETVMVEVAIPLVETTNAEQGGALSNQTINDLPLNGRNYQNLLTLRPGVTIFSGGGGWTQSSNGIRPDDNMYLVDGLNQNEPWTGMSIVNGNSLAGDVQTFIPLDAIQEFRTAQNVRADSGFKPGSVVNVGLKAGTNNLHGTAYAFGRTDAWDAKNYFDSTANGFPPFPLSLKQFGATAGGPLKKDKLFWFMAYESQLYDTAGSFTTTSPVTCGTGDAGCGLVPIPPAGTPTCNSPALPSLNCNLSLVDACKDLLLTPGGAGNITPLSAALFGVNTATCAVNANKPGAMIVPGSSVGLFPVNMATTVPGSDTVFPNLTNTSRADNGLVKLDYHVGEHNVINGYYFIGQNNGTWNDATPQLAPNWESLLYVRAQLGSGGWVWTPNSRWVNEFRGGYGRYTQSFYSADHTTPASKYGINTGVTKPFFGGFPIIFFPIDFNGQLGEGWPKLVGPDSVYDFVDHVSYLRGKHAFKFGGEITDNIHTGTITQYGKGRLKFKPFNSLGVTLENLLAGNVGTGSSLLTGNAFRDSHFWAYAGFLQDDWRATQRLTVNLGVRYELNTVLKEAHNLLGNFDPAVGMVQVGKQIPSLYNGDHNNFAPRVGFAWDVRGNGKTVIRAGGGVIYEQIAQQSFMALGNLLGAPSVPTAATIVVTDPVSGLPVVTPGTGTIDLQALVFNGGPGRRLLSDGWINNSATTSIFPTNATPVCGDGTSVPGINGATVLRPVGTNPCTIFAVDRNLRTPYVTNWNFGIQRAITNNMSLEVSYVGNHGTKLIGFHDINEINPQSAAEIACGHCEANFPFPKFPYLSYINKLSGLYHSNYNGLQATLTQRVSHGLSFTVGYTYSHALDNASSNWSGAGVIDNGFAPNSYYGDSDFDLRHRFTATVTYALPGRKGFAQMLEGWQINSIVMLQDGGHWGMLDTGNDFSGTGQNNNIPAALGEHWDFFGKPSDFKSNQNSIPYCFGPNFSTPSSVTCQQTTPGGSIKFSPAQTATMAAACLAGTNSIVDPSGTALANLNSNSPGAGGCFVQGHSVMVPPAFGTWANAGRNIFPGYPFKNWDMSVSKDWKIKERLTFQFRAEVFNLLNHPQFANPGGGPNGFNHNDPSVANLFGCGCATPDVAGENPVLGSGSNRAVQLGLKIIF
ncbi:MAG TPA: TonB-dependent receptor [Candidatus Acidoferrum sp.]|nr:TonB-dependent receptor [Candidatus Acidoferrum sp.]